MDVSNIITKSRVQTNTSAGQKSDALILQDLNIIYKEVFSRLATKSKKYTRQSYYAATEENQHEYSIPKPSVTETGIKRVLNVHVKYSSDWNHIPCKMYDTSTGVDNDYENENIPYCIVRDGSIFVYPAPTEVISDWIVVEWQYIPLDLETTTTSDNIKLDSEYHDILLSGLNMYNFADKQLFDKKAIAKQEFEEWIARMILEWWADPESAYETTETDIYNQSLELLP